MRQQSFESGRVSGWRRVSCTWQFSIEGDVCPDGDLSPVGDSLQLKATSAAGRDGQLSTYFLAVDSVTIILIFWKYRIV